jgi:hypothetical protein
MLTQLLIAEGFCWLSPRGQKTENHPSSTQESTTESTIRIPPGTNLEPHTALYHHISTAHSYSQLRNC